MMDKVNGASVDTASYYVVAPSGSAAAGEILPAPRGSEDPAAMLIELQKLMMMLRDSETETGRSRIERKQVLADAAIREVLEAKRREAEQERKNKDGGFLDGICTAFKALSVDLVKLDNITDPVGAVEHALEKAGDATIDSKQFWSDLEKGALEVAKWAAVAGSTALAVVSCGAAAPIAALAIIGAVASCAAAADSTFGILEKLGLSKDTAMWMDVGLSLGGALCSGGAGVAEALSATSTKAAETAVRTGAIVADATSGGADVAGGLAHIEVATFERDEKLLAADTKEAQARQAQIEKRIQALLDLMKDLIEPKEKSLGRINDAMSDYNAARLAVTRA